MDPKSFHNSGISIVAERRRQAIRCAFFCLGLFCLTLSNAWAQNITPNAQQLFQQAASTTDLNQKVSLLESALRLSPQFVDARLELAKALIELQQFRRAISQLDTVLSKDLKNAEGWFYKGRAYARLTEYNTAIRSFKQAISFKNDFLEFYIELGKAQFTTQSFDEALQSFQQGLTLAISKKDSNTQAEAWFWKGRAHEANGDTTNAARSYRQTLRLQPDFKEARAYLTNIENQAKLEALYQAAETAFRSLDWSGAARNYQQILAIDANFKDASQKLAIVQNKIKAQALADSAQALRRQQKFDEAIILLQQAINLDADRSSEFQILINQIGQVRQFAENQTKTMEPIITKEISPLSTPKDTSKADTAQNRSLGAPNDSVDRQPANTISEKRSLTSTLKWPATIAAALIIVILAFVLIGKRRTKPKPPEPTVRLSLPIELTEPKSLREVIKTIMDKQLQSTPLPREVIHPEFERFPLDRLLGRGGMGRVYKAYDRKLKRPVALKVIINQENIIGQNQFEELLKRFQREAQNTAQLSHPNIVNLYEFYDERDGEFFMTMEYIEGATVMQLLQEKKRLAVRDAVSIIKPACEALEYAHKREVIHRDIKPSNLMLNTEAVVKVVDFGIAKILSSQEPPYTETGFRIGTPEYMSPEQLNVEELDGRTDIFSLGLVFYQMLAGELPPKEIRRGKPVPKLSAIAREIPVRIDAIVEKMLASDREKRYLNAGEILDDLKPLEGKE
jgi:tetratricopeptide (TPR) repeat protein